MSTHRVLAIVALVVVVAGCSPAGSPSVTGTAPTAAPSIGPATPGPSPRVYVEYHKLTEGDHGGPQRVTIAGPVSVDYRVSGGCAFEVVVEGPSAHRAYPRLRLDVVEGEQTGTWTFQVPPGSYLVYPAEAVGCTFDVVVREPG